MSRFLVRVELHNAKWPDDYDKLHLAMAKEGFSKTIADSNGIVYQLPTAEYYKNDNSTLSDAIVKGKRAATAVGKTFGIIIGQCDSLMWEGLSKVY